MREKEKEREKRERVRENDRERARERERERERERGRRREREKNVCQTSHREPATFIFSNQKVNRLLSNVQMFEATLLPLSSSSHGVLCGDIL